MRRVLARKALLVSRHSSIHLLDMYAHMRMTCLHMCIPHLCICAYTYTHMYVCIDKYVHDFWTCAYGGIGCANIGILDSRGALALGGDLFQITRVAVLVCC